MGGNAFPELNTPRLSPEEYSLMRDKSMAILKQFYDEVVCPPEGPEKSDHGDVDLIVSQAKAQNDHESLQLALNAITRTKTGVITSFAVPLPDKEDTFAQVDIRRCKDGMLEWETWMEGYGDLVQIIGVVNRPLGLTMNHKGLSLRVAEVEPTNRKASLVFLTSDLSIVMDFLGLDAARYKQGFSTRHQIFAWCAAGRFYGPPPPRERDEDETKRDKKAYKNRPMFAQFYDQWLPANPNSWKNEVRWPREKVLEEVLKHFDVQEQYALILSTHRQLEHEKMVIQTIKAVIPYEGVGLQATIRGLKRWTSFDDGKAVLKPEAEPNNIETSPKWLTNLTEEKMVSFLEWVKTNYAEIRKREKRRSEARRTIGESPTGPGEVDA